MKTKFYSIIFFALVFILMVFNNVSAQAPVINVETEPNNTAATANPFSIAAQNCTIFSGAITPGADVDFFSFTAAAGSKVWILNDPGGSQNVGATSRDLVMDLIAADGITVIENDDDDGVGNGGDGTVETGLASAISGRTLTAGGTYYIRLRAFSATAIVNPYKLFIVVTNVPVMPPEIESNNTLGTANSIVTLSQTTGLYSAAISPAADADYYSVVALAGEILFISADADPERDGAGTDLAVEVRDDEDVLLLTIESSINGSLANPSCESANYKIITSGTYYIKVRHFSATGTGTYNLMVSAAQATPAAANGDIIISEFRVRGPNGANDEFIELYNTTNQPFVISTTDGSTGWALAASDGVTRFVIPNGTVIPAYGHYLGVNSVGYSLTAYPAGNGATAAGNITYVTNIPDNAGIALFTTSLSVNFTLANRMDAVGSTSEANTLYKEGTGYPALTPFSIDYTFYRKTSSGSVLDENNNATDFKFEDTNGTSAGAGQSLGAPGPQNLSSPVSKGNSIIVTLADPALLENVFPNYLRDLTSDPANNSTSGTMSMRYKIKNTGTSSITRLRFRIDSINTFPSLSGIADLRPRTSAPVTIVLPTGSFTAAGTTLEQPPSQPNGGGFNSTLSPGIVTLATPILAGDSIFVNLLFGIQQTGNFTITFTPEALPEAGNDAPFASRGNTTVGPFSALPCTMTCPANITLSNDPNQCGAVVNYAPPTTSGTCGTVTSSPASGSFFPVGTTTVTATSSDGTTCTFTITVNDTQAPTINCPANISVSNDANQCGAVVNYPPPTTGDNCPGVTVVSSPASGSFFPIGITTVTSTATDATGNSNTCTFTITVNDTQAPVITCPSDITVSNDADQCGAVVIYPAPTATDNCSGVTVVSLPASGSFFPPGATIVTNTATDETGNSTNCTFTVTVNDTQVPVITCPENIIVSNDTDQCGAIVNYPPPTAIDNCTFQGTSPFSVTQSSSAAIVPSNSISCNNGVGHTQNSYYRMYDLATSGLSGPFTINTVTFGIETASADLGTQPVEVRIHTLNGNFVLANLTLIGSQTYMVPNQTGTLFTATFTTPPTVPANAKLVLEIFTADGQAAHNLFFIGTNTAPETAGGYISAPDCGITEPTTMTAIGFPDMHIILNAAGVVAGQSSIVSLPASGSFFPTGITTVTSTATDASGNTATCTFTVTVNDTQAPVITCPENIAVLNDADQCGAVVVYEVTANDNCTGVTLVSSPASGSFFPIGTTSVTSVATDSSGNTATCIFTITVKDKQAPVITCPENITVSNDADQCGAIVVYTATTNDNCPGATVTSSPESGSLFPLGTTTVTSIATDAAGNISTCMFKVTVNDTQAPVITCPSDIIVSNDADQCGAVVNFSASTFSDNCSGVTMTTSPVSGSFFPTGITTVTSTATDAAGNIAECTFTVTVNDTQAPVVSCPDNIIATSTTGLCSRIVNYSIITSDNCPGVTVTGSPASGSAFSLGVTTVSVTATDIAGNISTCSFTVTVTDTDLPVITGQPVTATECAGNTATFTVNAIKATSYQWQINEGASFVDISGENAATLTLNNITMNMSGNNYRAIVNGVCTDVTSNAVSLVVNPLPTVQITAVPYSKIKPGQLTSMVAGFAGTPGTFTWYRNERVVRSTIQPAITNLNIDSLGIYKVLFTDVNGCTAISNEVALTADPTFEFFVYPNPNNGRFTVRFYAQTLNTQRTLNVYDAAGAIVFKKPFVMSSSYERMDVDLTKYASGIYTVALIDADGKVIGSKKVIYVH